MAKKKSKTETENKQWESIKKLFQIISKSAVGTVLKYGLLATVILLLNLLVAQNNFAKFYLFTGIELVILFLFSLFYLAWQQRDVDKES